MIRRVHTDLATLVFLAADEVLSALAAPETPESAPPRPQVLLTAIEVSLPLEAEYVPALPAGAGAPRAVGRLRLSLPSRFPTPGERRRPSRLRLRITPTAGEVPRLL